LERKPRILAVDDTRTNLRIIQEALGDAFDLRLASSGEEALDQSTRFNPDIVLLDIVMPGIDGYETCRRIRQHPDLQHVKIIMVSAQAGIDDRLQAYEAGANDYLLKPFEQRELLAKIQVYLHLKSSEEVERFKADVITLLGHEMRTPLTTMLGPAKMLLEEGDLPASERQQLARLIYLGAKRLHELVEKAQLLGSLWSGTWKPSKQPVDLLTVLRPALDRTIRRAAPREVRVIEDLAPCPDIPVDPHGIDQVISAILDNALRFSPDGGEMRVTLRSLDDAACLTISDQGPGIHPDFIPRVFDAFAKSDIHHHDAGQGLSMAIARQLVLRHGGKLTVESTLGQGATFRLQLPRAADAAAA
jgi:signal transduction histidine kinase